MSVHINTVTHALDVSKGVSGKNPGFVFIHLHYVTYMRYIYDSTLYCNAVVVIVTAFIFYEGSHTRNNLILHAKSPRYSILHDS